MNYDVNFDDIKQIIASEHYNPHLILGPHSTTNGGTVINAFLPEAQNVSVIYQSNEYKMEKIHDDGFYTININEKITKKYQFKITNYENHSWLLYDPYAYENLLSDFDLHLFSEGTHYEIFHKLGAHIVEIDGVKGVLFAVWAPNAKRVSVIGDFNHWDGRHNPMKSRGNSGVWELFIPDLNCGENYKFEIKTKNNAIIEKADPFAFYSELRPKTASRIYETDFKWTDSKYLKKRDTSSDLSKPVSIYELHPGSWRKGEHNSYLSYRSLAKELIPYIIEMGYTHIELMGIAEHPFDGSWGYQVTGYYAPTSRYGEPADFAYFINECHKNNVGVIIDWVPAHFPTDEHGLARFDGTALYEHEDPRKGFHKDWTTYIFNYGRNEVRNFLIANAIFWADIYHVDGLRVDAVASMLYLDYARKPGEWVPNQYGGNENLEAVDFIKTLNEKIYSKHPGFMMIAEESTAWAGVSRPTYLGGLGFGLKWNMGWMNDFLRYIEKNPIHRKYHHNELTFSMIYAFNENFILVLSHDEVVHGKKSILNKMPGDDWQKFANERLAIGYMYAHPGKKLLFMGTEFGQWKEWDNEHSLDWHLLEWDMHKKLKMFHKDLNLLYRKNPALFEKDFSAEGFSWINSNDSESSVISFVRRTDDDRETIVVVANFTPIVRYNYRIGVPQHGMWEEIFNSDADIYGGSGVGNCGGFWSDEIAWNNNPFSLNLTIPPLSVCYFKIKI